MMITYLQTYFQPLAGLLIAFAIVALVGYINWYGDTKARAVQWIAKNIFRNKFGSEASAESLFKVLTSYLGAVGAIGIIVAILYLTY
jgi:hypothetical protein